jgi:Flp pilus assembly protein TadG
MSSRTARASGERGQALVEFALVIPIFLALLFGILDMGRAVWANNVVAHAAREAARHAAVAPAPTKDQVRDVAREFATGGGAIGAVEVCYGSGCSGNTDTTASTERGTSVTGTIRSSVSMVTTSLIGMGTFGITGSSTMLVSRP